MDLSQARDLLSQVQAGARVSTAIGEPVAVGERMVIPAAEVIYGGGGGGGSGKSAREQPAEGGGGGGGGGVRIRPLGCWVFDQDGERWVPALDVNRLVLIAGGVLSLLLLTARAFVRRK